MMPHMDGIVTMRALQRINSDVRVIVVSGFLENQKIAELTTSSGVRFLQKPFTTKKLLVMLAEVLRRTRSGSLHSPPFFLILAALSNDAAIPTYHYCE